MRETAEGVVCKMDVVVQAVDATCATRLGVNSRGDTDDWTDGVLNFHLNLNLHYDLAS